MIVIKSTKVYCFDVDRTLIFTDQECGALLQDGVEFGESILINNRWFSPHQEHLELMKDLTARGHTVAVWSAGGAEWAEAVIRALDMEKYVDLVMSKPDGYCDDKSVLEWLPETDRFYIPLEGFTGGK